MTTDDQFERDLGEARRLLDQEDVAGLYVGVVRDDEMDFVLSHRFDDPETVGMGALSLLAQHLRAVSDEADVPIEQVAQDAAGLADRFSED